MKVIIELLTKYLGNKIVAALLFIGLGVAGYTYLGNQFLTTDAFAKEKVDILQTVQKSGLLLQQQMLLMRSDMLKAEIRRLTEQLKTTDSPDFVKGCLNGLGSDLKRVQEQLDSILNDLTKQELPEK